MNKTVPYNDLHGSLENCFRVKFNINQNRGEFTRIWDFAWRVSDCEELAWQVKTIYFHKGFA